MSSENDRRDTLQDVIAAILVGFGVMLLAWSFQQGSLTPEIATDLLNMIADLAGEFFGSQPSLGA